MCEWLRYLCASTGIEMLAEVGHPFAAAQVPMAAAPGRAPARPLAEKQNWASVCQCVSLEPYLVAITQKNLEVASNMYQKQSNE